MALAQELVTWAAFAAVLVGIAFVAAVGTVKILDARQRGRMDLAERLAKLAATVAELERTAERVKAIAPVLASPAGQMRRAAVTRAAWEQMRGPEAERLEFDMTAADGRHVHLENGGMIDHEQRDHDRCAQEPWPFTWTAEGHPPEVWDRIDLERDVRYLMNQGHRRADAERLAAGWHR